MTEDKRRELRVMLLRWEGVSGSWGLSAEEEGGLLGGTGFTGGVADIASWRASRMEDRIRLLVDLATELSAVMGDERRIRRWLRRPLGAAGDRTPIEAMTSSIEWIVFLRRALTRQA